MRTLIELQEILITSTPGAVIPVTEQELAMLVFPKQPINVEDTPSEIEAILAERGSRYGSFSGHALITQNIKACFQDSPNWKTLSDSQKEALEMTAHKIGRILNGDPNYADSWVDIVGYNQLIVDQLNGKNT